MTRFCYVLYGDYYTAGREMTYSQCGGKANCADSDCEWNPQPKKPN
jgi:hypothetical protein